MSEREIVMWGIHAGRGGEADGLFRKDKRIALGWSAIGDLRLLPADREAFKTAVAAAYPEFKAAAIPNQAGQIYRFIHEMQVGDLVVYPSKQDRVISVGRVVGDYEYNPKQNPAFPHQRKVEWISSQARTSFSQGALYESGSAMSFFQIRNYAEEFRSAMEGKPSAPMSVVQDEGVSIIAEEIEEAARDFVLKALAERLKGHPLAHFVAHLLTHMGYRTRVAPEGPDGGIDIIAHKDELGFERPFVKVQVKSTEGTTGEPQVAALYGKIDDGEYGLFVTLGDFTAQARSFARSKSNLRLISGEELTDLVFAHYESFDAQYRAVLPMRRVYVPQPID